MAKGLAEKRLEAAVDAARKAGALLFNALTSEKRITHKGKVDLQTQYDLQSERLIVDELHRAFPADEIRAEEGQAQVRSRDYWLIDPLDGTTNFVHGIPYFTVSIAYIQNGKAALGVVYEPSRDELYSASSGGGAFLNGARLHVSSTERLQDALLSSGFPYDAYARADNNYDHWQDLYNISRGVRHFAAASLDCAYVAAGRIDGYWELELQSWDIAAGVLLVREAGGQVTQVDGSPDVLREPISILATNGRLHDELLLRLGTG